MTPSDHIALMDRLREWHDYVPPITVAGADGLRKDLLAAADAIESQAMEIARLNRTVEYIIESERLHVAYLARTENTQLAEAQERLNVRADKIMSAEARLAEVLAEVDRHHDPDCSRMRGPYGEQWRDDSYPCNCWISDLVGRSRS